MRLRTVRAVLFTAAIWGMAWAVIGAMIGLLQYLRSPPESAYLLVLRMLLTGPMTVLGVAGLLAGGTFAAVLSRAERGRTLETISARRAAAWGALGGLAFSLAGAALVARNFGLAPLIHVGVLFWTGVAATCGALSAAGSLAIARKGTPGLLEEAAAMQRVRGAGTAS